MATIGTYRNQHGQFITPTDRTVCLWAPGCHVTTTEDTGAQGIIISVQQDGSNGKALTVLWSCEPVCVIEEVELTSFTPVIGSPEADGLTDWVRFLFEKSKS